MKSRLLSTALVCVSLVSAQTPASYRQQGSTPLSAASSNDTSSSMSPAVATTFTRKAAPIVRKGPARGAALTPLTPRERTVQLLDRFTFGERPGDVDRVLALGPDKWLSQQLAPDGINDSVCNQRLQQYPTLQMTPAQALNVFPDRPQVAAVAQGKAPYPTDSLMNAVFQVQVYRYQAEQDQKKADGSTAPHVELTDAEKAAKKQADQAEAARIFGELIAMPKNARMSSIIALPVEQRIALTASGNLNRQQQQLLFADFTPREREAFQAMSGNVSSSGYIGQELAQARILRDILTERQLEEVMTDFWFNHFNVFIGKDSDQWYTTSYERENIRKHALGSFHDLLLATAQSPAMMVYLDNWLSIGPDSLANGVNPQNPRSKRGNKGLNENYGREVMELHTVGVNGGYTQADVTALAAILTGWGVDQPQKGGGFAFDPKRHEPGPKTWFGYTINDDGTLAGTEASALPPSIMFGASAVPANADSIKQGLTALNILAASPKTAHFISYLLAQKFVADMPPAALVDRLAGVYLSSRGDIKAILRALAASPEFNSRQYFRNKVKTPVEFVASAFRATATDPQDPSALVTTIRQMGMEMYHALPPTGYYLTADQWMNSVALVDRLNFAYQLTTNHYSGQKFDAPRLLAIGLMQSGSVAALSPKPQNGQAIPVSAVTNTGTSLVSGGEETALHVLENTIVDAPISTKTNQLIDAQIQKQPANGSSVDTLDVMTALVLGSPEFQVR